MSATPARRAALFLALAGLATACPSTPEASPELPPPPIIDTPEPEPPSLRPTGDPSWPQLRIKSAAVCVDNFISRRRQHARAELFIFVYQDGLLIAASLAADQASLTGLWTQRPFTFRYEPDRPLDIRVLDLDWRKTASAERLFELAADYLEAAPQKEAEARDKARAARAAAMAGPNPPEDPEAAHPDPPDLGPYVLSRKRVEGGLLPKLTAGFRVLTELSIETRALVTGVLLEGPGRARWDFEVRSPDGAPRPPLVAQPEELRCQLKVVRATFPSKTSAGLEWDVGFFGGGWPDPYVIATYEETWSDGEKAYYQLAVTAEDSNTPSASWKDEDHAIAYPRGRDLVFFMLDRDLTSDDRMGRFRVRPLTRGQYEFPSEEGVGTLELELR